MPIGPRHCDPLFLIGFVARLGRASVLAVIGLLLTGGVAAAAPASLSVPQSTAFATLGHSCGGIQEQVLATGFTSTHGPRGVVYLKTVCSTGGRGSRTVTYSAWLRVVWTLTGAVRSSAVMATAPTNINPNFRATDAYGDTVYNELTAVNVTPPSCTVANTTYCHYQAFFTGIPAAAPTAVSASQVGDQFQISWTPDPARAPVIISSTLTATPVNSTAPVLTATVAGTGTVGAIGPLQPQTTYSITVASVDAGGLGASSSPITATSTPATVAPGAPTGLTAAWTSAGNPGDQLHATWQAAPSGDSPIDAYQVTATASNADPPVPPPVTATVPGSQLTATLAANDLYDWSVRVRAHNAAGWGPSSTAVILLASG